MRSITEQLYLNGGNNDKPEISKNLSITDIQEKLTSGRLLVEFYSDGSTIWAFMLNEQSVSLRRLPLTIEQLNQLLSQLQVNISAILKIDPHAPAIKSLIQLGNRILRRLHSLLIEPLDLPQEIEKLTIVPYGVLHYLPFSSLYDGISYLIERYELVILPAAGMVTRPAPERNTGAMVLAHSWEGKLPHTLAEAQM